MAKKKYVAPKADTRMYQRDEYTLPNLKSIVAKEYPKYEVVKKSDKPKPKSK